MQRQPWLAGVCLGLLSYKPHLGLLIPIALIAGARWRVFVSAALVTVGDRGVVVFRLRRGKLAGLFRLDADHQPRGLRPGRRRLQPAAKPVRPGARARRNRGRWRGRRKAACAAVLVVAVAWLWFSRAAFELKAAGLSCAALLATPYLYIYDLVALTIPAAFLLRLGARARISRRARASDCAPRWRCCSAILTSRRKWVWRRR